MIGTPGRLIDLSRKNILICSNIKYFIIDECDKVLENLRMRENVQEIVIQTPMTKQVMMFSATLPSETKIIAKKFMVD